MKLSTLISIIVGILSALSIMLGAGVYVGRNITINEGQDANIAKLMEMQKETQAHVLILTTTVDALVKSGVPFRLNDAERQYNQSLKNFYNGDEFWLAVPTHQDVNQSK